MFCSVVDGAIMHGNNVCCAQLAISIWITWWVDRVKGQEKQVVEQKEVVMAVSPEHFQEAFTNRAGSPTTAPAPVEAAVHSAAAKALDAQDNLRTIAKADDLLLDINTGNIAQSVSDESILPDVEVQPNMTVRNDPKEILGPTKPQVEKSSVPLPRTPSMIDLDDLDV